MNRMVSIPVWQILLAWIAVLVFLWVWGRVSVRLGRNQAENLFFSVLAKACLRCGKAFGVNDEFDNGVLTLQATTAFMLHQEHPRYKLSDDLLRQNSEVIATLDMRERVASDLRRVREAAAR